MSSWKHMCDWNRVRNAKLKYTTRSHPPSHPSYPHSALSCCPSPINFLLPIISDGGRYCEYKKGEILSIIMFFVCAELSWETSRLGRFGRTYWLEKKLVLRGCHSNILEIKKWLLTSNVSWSVPFSGIYLNLIWKVWFLTLDLFGLSLGFPFCHIQVSLKISRKC